MSQFPVQQMLFAYGASMIKSIQQVSITIPVGQTTATATINAVVAANSARFFGGINPTYTGVSPNIVLPGVALGSGANPTTVIATRNTSDPTYTVTVNATIVEFQSGIIKSSQDGTIALSTSQTSNSGTISAVTTGNAVCIFNGSTYSSSAQNSGDYMLATTLASSTAVNALRGTNSNSVAAVAYFNVLEFNAGILNSSTQSGSVTCPPSATVATISAVTSSQAIVVNGGWNYFGPAGTGITQSCLSLTSGTTVAQVSGTSGGPNVTHFFTVVEFKKINVKSLNRATITIAPSTTSNTASVAAVNTAKSLANFTGCVGTQVTDFALMACKLALTNPTTVTASQNGSSGSVTNTVGYELLEFN